MLYVPKLTSNLFSVRAAAEKGNVIKFRGNKCWISDASGKLRGTGSLVNKLYKLDCEEVTNEHFSKIAQESSDLWHQRLGHVHEQRLKSCIEKTVVKGICCDKVDDLSFCVWLEKCIANHFRQLKKFVHHTSYSWCIVMSVVPCKLSHSEEQSISSRSRMIIHDVALCTS